MVFLVRRKVELLEPPEIMKEVAMCNMLPARLDEELLLARLKGRVSEALFVCAIPSTHALHSTIRLNARRNCRLWQYIIGFKKLLK